MLSRPAKRREGAQSTSVLDERRRPRIHLIEMLLRELAPEHALGDELAAEARSLDKYYTTTRYPDVLDYALPATSFVRRKADSALVIARGVLAFVETHLPQRPT